MDRIRGCHPACGLKDKDRGPHILRQSLSRSVSGPVPLVPPDTEGVRELLAAEGTSATLMDVAKGIIARLLENPELEGAACP